MPEQPQIGYIEFQQVIRITCPEVPIVADHTQSSLMNYCYQYNEVETRTAIEADEIVGCFARVPNYEYPRQRLSLEIDGKFIFNDLPVSLIQRRLSANNFFRFSAPGQGSRVNVKGYTTNDYNILVPASEVELVLQCRRYVKSIPSFENKYNAAESFVGYWNNGGSFVTVPLDTIKIESQFNYLYKIEGLVYWNNQSTNKYSTEYVKRISIDNTEQIDDKLHFVLFGKNERLNTQEMMLKLNCENVFGKRLLIEGVGRFDSYLTWFTFFGKKQEDL